MSENITSKTASPVCSRAKRVPRRHRYSALRKASLFEEDGLAPPTWLGGLHSATKSQAAEKGIGFRLSLRDLEDTFRRQHGRCAVTGREFDETVLTGAFTRHDGASVDRINPRGIYEVGNCRIVTFQANAALNDWGDDALLSFCRDVLQHRDRASALRRSEEYLTELDARMGRLTTERDVHPFFSTDWNQLNLELADTGEERNRVKLRIIRLFRT